MARHRLVVLGANGDRTVTYDPALEEDVERAVEEFERLLSQGYSAFQTKPVEKRIERLETRTEEVMLIPQIAGG